MSVYFTDNTGFEYRDGTQFFIKFNQGNRFMTKNNYGINKTDESNTVLDIQGSSGGQILYNSTSVSKLRNIYSFQSNDLNSCLFTIRGINSTSFRLVDADGTLVSIIPIDTGLQIFKFWQQGTEDHTGQTAVAATIHPSNPDGVNTFLTTFRFGSTNGTTALVADTGSSSGYLGITNYNVFLTTGGLGGKDSITNTIVSVNYSVNSGAVPAGSFISLIPYIQSECPLYRNVLNGNNISNRGNVTSCIDYCANTTSCDTNMVQYCSLNNNITNTICKGWGNASTVVNRHSTSDPLAIDWCRNHLSNKEFCSCINSQEFQEVQQYLIDNKNVKLSEIYPLCGYKDCSTTFTNSWKLGNQNTLANCTKIGDLCIQYVAFVNSNIKEVNTFQTCTINSSLKIE